VNRNRTAIAPGEARVLAVCGVVVMLLLPSSVSGQAQHAPGNDAAQTTSADEAQSVAEGISPQIEFVG
jgi:hypothetical protein